MSRDRHWLLASDLDGTLTGDPSGLEALLNWFKPRREQWLLAYVTGRGWDSMWELIREASLPVPVALITDVGTAVHLPRVPVPAVPDHFRLDHEWAGLLQRQWPVAEAEQLVERIPGVFPQPGIRATMRRSYHVAGPEVAAQVWMALDSARLPVRIVLSSGRDLDLMPAFAGKGAALRYLTGRLGVLPWRVIACGDSGNDLDMLEAGMAGVVVGNAQPELHGAALPACVYRANAPHAWGILEGLQWWESVAAGRSF